MKRILPVSLIILGAALVLSTAGWYYLGTLLANPAPLPLPNRIAGLSLTGQMTGAQAAGNFAYLHGKRFPITSGAVGLYGNQQVTLWVAGTPFGFMAADMVNSMRARIAKGNSPFTPTNEIVISGRTVYVLEGMGQAHFYFQSGNLVIWLAADPPIADEALKQTLQAYP